MIFFTSDQHFSHSNIIKYCNRPFLSIGEMNKTIIDNYNSIIKKSDTVYHLGDFCWRGSNEECGIKNFLCQLNGIKILISGNHDSCFRMHKKSNKYRQIYIEAGFSEVLQEQIISDKDLGKILLSHFPWRENENEKYYNYRPNKQNYNVNYLFCGHIHQNWKFKNNMINVGVDVNNFKPISINEIRFIINENSTTNRTRN